LGGEGLFIAASISFCVVAIFRWLISFWFNLDGHKYLEICPFLEDFQIYWNVVFKAVSDNSLDFCGVGCYSPFAFLILLIWIFYLLSLVRFARDLSTCLFCQWNMFLFR
jgi:hypothetical protein